MYAEIVSDAVLEQCCAISEEKQFCNTTKTVCSEIRNRLIFAYAPEIALILLTCWMSTLFFLKHEAVSLENFDVAEFLGVKLQNGWQSGQCVPVLL